MNAMNTSAAAAAALLSLSVLAACSDGGSGGGAMAEPDMAFDGETLDGWHTVGAASFRVEDGEIVSDGDGSGFVATDASYEDFSLTVEFWINEGGNSGVYFRCEDASAPTDSTCYEANIYDNRPDQSGRTGAIVHLAPPEVEIDAGGQWNTYEITAEGSHITVVLNGQQTVSADTGKESEHSSPILLQVGDGSTVRFRNISIQEL